MLGVAGLGPTTPSRRTETNNLEYTFHSFLLFKNLVPLRPLYCPPDFVCLLQVFTLMLRLGHSNAKCHPLLTTCPAPRTSTPFTRASPLWWTSSETTSHPSKTHPLRQPNLQHRHPFNPIAGIMTTLTIKAHFRTHRVEK